MQAWDNSHGAGGMHLKRQPGLGSVLNIELGDMVLALSLPGCGQAITVGWIFGKLVTCRFSSAEPSRVSLPQVVWPW